MYDMMASQSVGKRRELYEESERGYGVIAGQNGDGEEKRNRNGVRDKLKRFKDLR